jgi:hypothetical protein
VVKHPSRDLKPTVSIRSAQAAAKYNAVRFFDRSVNADPKPGMPLIVGKAPRARSLSAAFILKGKEHFEGVFEQITKYTLSFLVCINHLWKCRAVQRRLLR